jgi:hypothetical protein
MLHKHERLHLVLFPKNRTCEAELTYPRSQTLISEMAWLQEDQKDRGNFSSK